MAPPRRRRNTPREPSGHAAIGLGRPDCFYRQPRAGSADASSHARRDGPPGSTSTPDPQVGLGLSPARALSHRCSRRAWRPSTDQFRDRPARRRGAARAREPFVREGHVETHYSRSFGARRAGADRAARHSLGASTAGGSHFSRRPARAACRGESGAAPCALERQRGEWTFGTRRAVVSVAEVPESVASEDHRNTRWNCERSGRRVQPSDSISRAPTSRAPLRRSPHRQTRRAQRTDAPT